MPVGHALPDQNKLITPMPRIQKYVTCTVFPNMQGGNVQTATLRNLTKAIKLSFETQFWERN